MITDEELLAACLSAGKPGTESHREACRLYRRSVLEWRAGHGRWLEEHASQDVPGQRGGLAVIEFGALDDACGTHRGFNRHQREKTLTCPRCHVAERAYQRLRKRAQRAAKAGREQAWAEAA